MSLNHNQSGRSIVEMLGVLALMSVLVFFGVMGYRKINNKSQADSVARLMQTLVAERQNQMMIGDYNRIIPDRVVKGPYGTQLVIKSTQKGEQKLFTIQINASNQGFCEALLECDLLKNSFSEGTCPGIISFYFQKNNSQKNFATYTNDSGKAQLCPDNATCSDDEVVCQRGTFSNGICATCATDTDCNDECQVCNATSGQCEQACIEKEYLQSSGTQWIDTGVNLSGAVDPLMEIDCTITAGNNTDLFGYGFSKTPWRLNTEPNTTYLNYGSQSATITPLIFTLNERTLFTFGKNVKVNGVVKKEFNSFTFPTNSVKLYLLRADHSACCPAKLYNVKISTQDGVLLRDFVPVLDAGGVACMYDKVEKKLYYNQGYGDFTTD